MGTTDISNTKSNGDVIDETWYNDFRSTIIGNFVPRNAATGVVDNSCPDLGAFIYPWGNLYAKGLIINGIAVNFASLTGIPNSIKSGKVRTTSAFPDFILANGAAPSFQVLGSVTNLVLDINTNETVVTTDLLESGLTVAPVANNTCQVNDINAIGQTSTKYLGEDDTIITIDNAGSEITDRIGQYVIFLTGTEYMLAYVNSATELTKVYRGFLFDSSSNPIPRVALNNNDILTLMSTGWVFVEDDAITVDVTYNSPIYSFLEPSAPVTGDYWFDRTNETWKRYSGSAFIVINRTLVGLVAINTTNCIASRSFNFNKDFNDFNPIALKYTSATTIESSFYDFNVSVYGNPIINQVTKYEWDILTNLESGQVETASTTYYAYITELGEKILSDIKPYNQKGELGGYYHPYNTWRAIGFITNDVSNDFDSAALVTYGVVTKLTQTFTSSGTWSKPSFGTFAKVQIWAGGAGAGGAGPGNSNQSCGGGGGSYREDILLLSDLNQYESVEIGAGGSGNTSNGNGVNGGFSSFAGLISYGGSGGSGGSGAFNTRFGGPSGGVASTAPSGTQFNDTTILGRGGTSSSVDQGQNFKGYGGETIGGGGGGATSLVNFTENVGGSSIYGGGGGGGGSNTIAGGGVGGNSRFAGNGGDAGGGDGFYPSGGGSGFDNTGNGGSGAAGRIIIQTW